MPETCNGIDDDFNGAVDDGLICHAVTFRFEGADDDAYLWIDSPSGTDQAICSAWWSRDRGNATCDLSAIVQGQGLDLTNVPFTLKLGNGGGFNTQGAFYLDIDGNETLLSSQAPVWAHTGWTHRQTFNVNFAAGSYTAAPADTCFNVWDCPN